MSVSYFVRYEGMAADRTEFLRYYRERHALILARFPGIRRIVLHQPTEWHDRFPVNPDRFTLLAQMIFDTEDDLARALQSEARAEARVDFADFPPFEGKVFHQATVSEEVFSQVSASLALKLHGAQVKVHVNELVIAGWTGRDQAAIAAHIKEMKEWGVPGPTQTPMYYRVGASLLTTSGEIEVVGRDSSGEAEFVLFNVDGEILLGTGSDHTDRKAEAVGITLAKQMCPKVVAEEVWRFADVEPHWDSLVIRAWATISGERVLYQEGNVTVMRHPRELMELFTARTGLNFGPGFAMYGGTFAAIGGIRWAEEFEFAIEDPVLRRRISHHYKVKGLPIEG